MWKKRKSKTFQPQNQPPPPQSIIPFTKNRRPTAENKESHSSRHRVARDEAGRPRRLKIETTGEAVNVQQLACKKQSGTNFTFHRFEIHLRQLHAAARHELFLVQTFSRHKKFRARELLREHLR